MAVNADLKKAKSELRTIIRSRLATLSQQQLTVAGEHAARQLSLIPGWDNYRSVLAFFSMKDEMDTQPLMETVLKTEKSLFVPRIEGELLVFYQINQDDTANSSRILTADNFPALVITPGMAFDRRYYRMGRGRGYYDRFFAALDESGRNYTAIGLCMNCQLVDEVPAGTCDKKMDLLLTESGLIQFQ